MYLPISYSLQRLGSSASTQATLVSAEPKAKREQPTIYTTAVTTGHVCCLEGCVAAHCLGLLAPAPRQALALHTALVVDGLTWLMYNPRHHHHPPTNTFPNTHTHTHTRPVKVPLQQIIIILEDWPLALTSRSRISRPVSNVLMLALQSKRRHSSTVSK